MAEKDFRQLKGPDKAAVLFRSLGEEHSSKIWPLLDDEEIKEISQNMANLGAINSEIVEKLFLEFVNNFSSTGSLTGTFDSTERLLMKALPSERVNQIMEEIRGPAGRTMWDKLANRSDEHTSELQSLMRLSYAVFCLKQKTTINTTHIK